MLGIGFGDAHLRQHQGPVYNIHYQETLSGQAPGSDDLDVVDNYFVTPDRFTEAADKLHGRGVAVLYGKPGIGKSASGLALLRRHAEKYEADLSLIVLESDWREPSTGRLPTGESCGYILDLGEEDGPPSAKFAENLVSLGRTLLSRGSVLVVVTPDELWKPVIAEARRACRPVACWRVAAARG